MASRRAGAGAIPARRRASPREATASRIYLLFSILHERPGHFEGRRLMAPSAAGNGLPGGRPMEVRPSRPAVQHGRLRGCKAARPAAAGGSVGACGACQRFVAGEKPKSLLKRGAGVALAAHVAVHLSEMQIQIGGGIGIEARYELVVPARLFPLAVGAVEIAPPEVPSIGVPIAADGFLVSNRCLLKTPGVSEKVPQKSVFRRIGVRVRLQFFRKPEDGFGPLALAVENLHQAGHGGEVLRITCENLAVEQLGSVQVVVVAGHFRQSPGRGMEAGIQPQGGGIVLPRFRVVFRAEGQPAAEEFEESAGHGVCDALEEGGGALPVVVPEGGIGGGQERSARILDGYVARQARGARVPYPLNVFLVEAVS